MFRKTFTGSLVAASLTASALLTLPSASAAPKYIESNTPSTVGAIPSGAHVVMSENGKGIATWLRQVNGKNAVQASYFAGGNDTAWSAPATVSPPNADVANPTAAINDDGVAVAAWQQKSEDDLYQVRVNRFVGGGFTGSEEISTGTYSANAPMDAAVDGSGRFWAAYQVSDGNQVNRIRVIADGGKGPAQLQWWNLGDDSSFAPDIAVNRQGEALLAFYNAGNGSSTIDVRRLAAGSMDWSATKSVGTTDQYRVETETVLADNGSASVGYVREDLNDDFRATVSRVEANGTPVDATFVSPAGDSAYNISLAQNDTGAALLAWDQDHSKVGYKTRAYETAGWASGSAIDAVTSGATYPKAAISDTGAYVIGWTDDGDLHSVYRGLSVLPFVKYSSSAIDFAVTETSVGIDNQGNALVAGVYALPDPTKGALHVKFVDAGGPSSSLATPSVNTLTGKVNLAWTATDRFSDVTAYDVHVTTTRWNRFVSKSSSFLTGAPTKAAQFTAAPGATYCFQVRARDAHANYGGFTAPKCTTTPVDDRAAVIAKGFKRAKAPTSFLGTYSVAKKKNAVMTLQQVKARRIAILVTKVAKGGKIQVRFAGKTLGTYSLKGAGNKKYVAVKDLGKVTSGTLSIKVVSKTGKVVRIDGIVLGK